MSDCEKVTIERLFRLDGDTALVTGGGGGLGRMAALALGGAGAHVAVIDIDGAAAERVAGEICERRAETQCHCNSTSPSATASTK